MGRRQWDSSVAQLRSFLARLNKRTELQKQNSAWSEGRKGRPWSWDILSLGIQCERKNSCEMSNYKKVLNWGKCVREGVAQKAGHTKKLNLDSRNEKLPSHPNWGNLGNAAKKNLRPSLEIARESPEEGSLQHKKSSFGVWQSKFYGVAGSGRNNANEL